MMLTVNRLHSEGVRHFAMVHDSFGVHASDIDFLNRALREDFVASIPNLQCRDSLKNSGTPTLACISPRSPSGILDIRQVISSPYFFA